VYNNILDEHAASIFVVNVRGARMLIGYIGVSREQARQHKRTGKSE
jgi:hypothetical protein